MAFNSLHHLLGHLHQQAEWRSHQEFQRLVANWSAIVGQAVAQQTRPVAIRRGVLQVAASNSVWVQNLMFERRRILEKLNAQVKLTETITEIHFSTAYWRQGVGPNLDSLERTQVWKNHPSRLVERSQPSSTHPAATPQDAQSAFQQWSAQMKARSQHLPLCPHCQCPTPPGELKRWTVCSLCAARDWATTKTPDPAPEIRPDASKGKTDRM